jgi:hypothetical protein
VTDTQCTVLHGGQDTRVARDVSEVDGYDDAHRWLVRVRAGGDTQAERYSWLGRARHVTSPARRGTCTGHERFGFQGCGGWGTGAREGSRFGCPDAAT